VLVVLISIDYMYKMKWIDIKFVEIDTTNAPVIKLIGVHSSSYMDGHSRGKS